MNTVEETSIHEVINLDNTAIVANLPVPFIQEATIYNALPTYAELNRVQGEVSVVNRMTIMVFRLSSALTNYLDSLDQHYLN
jgi:hypothetical protein